MKKYYRKIVFTNSNMKAGFRFEDRFQILPINMDGKPQNWMLDIITKCFTR